MRQAEGWIENLHVLLERSFDYYYGEGGATSPDDPVLMSQGHQAVALSGLRQFSPDFAAGPAAEFRLRQPDGPQPIPGETTPSAGLKAVWDTRDNRLNSRAGGYAAFTLRGIPGIWLREPGGDVLQGEADLRHFLPLGDLVTQAAHFSFGFSGGLPSYLYRFRLGGTDLLRGYQDNRFRGKNFYVLQEELRFLLWRMLSFNVSMDVGNASDIGFDAPHLTGQAGLRVGLPPDWGMKARFDLGWARDNQALSVQFGEVF
jgi:hypothetical protein